MLSISLGLLNEERDVVTVDVQLAAPYSINMTTVNNGTMREILITGNAPVRQYEQVHINTSLKLVTCLFIEGVPWLVFLAGLS